MWDTVWSASGFHIGASTFLIYVNDLPYSIPCHHMCLYADDTTMLTKASSEDLLRVASSEAMQHAKTWFTSNYLKLNENKTEIIRFALGRDAEIKTVNFLRLQMDSKLTW